jgi:hypothetical protein
MQRKKDDRQSEKSDARADNTDAVTRRRPMAR